MGTSQTAWRSTRGGVATSSAIDPGGARLATTQSGTTGYLLADLHANLAAVVNSGETALLAATRYDPFGQTVAAADSGSGFPTPWRFQGRLDLSPDNHPLYAFGARNYDPGSGAFTSLDSYAGSPGDPLSLNRFAYAEANPWTLVDPDGHMAETCGGQCGGFASDAQQQAFEATMQQRAVARATSVLHAHDPAANAPGFGGCHWGCTPVNSQPGLGSGLDWLQVARHFAGSAGTAVDVSILAAIFCVGTVGVGCAVLGGLALGYGVYTSVKTWSDPNVSAQAKVNLIADWGGNAAGGIGLLRLGYGPAVTREVQTGDSGVVTFRSLPGMSAEEIAQMRAYCAACENARLQGGLSSTGRVSTAGALRLAATRAAAFERVAAAGRGEPYVGQVGHAPDTTWTANPDAFAWIDMSGRVNSSLGGQARWYPLGFQPTKFVFLEE